MKENFNILIYKFRQVQYKIIKRLNLPLLAISFDKLGIEFLYYGSNVIYVWPWRRKNYKYLDINCEGGFNSLAELKKFWDELFDYFNLNDF